MGVHRCISCDVRRDKTVKSFFKMPVDCEKRKVWIENLAIKRNLPIKSFVCEEHFDKNDVLKGSPETRGINGEILIASVPYKMNRLRPGAVPLPVDIADPPSPLECSILSITGISTDDISNGPSSRYTSSGPDSPMAMELDTSSITDNLMNACQFNNILAVRHEIADWTSHHDATSGVLVFVSYKNNILREFVINADSKIQARVMGNPISIQPTPVTVEDFKRSIAQLHQTSSCSGYLFYEMFQNVNFQSAYKDKNVMRHKQCPIVIPHGTICLKCHTLERTLFKAVDNSKKKKQRMRSNDTASPDVQFYHKKQKMKTQRLTRKKNKLNMLQDKIKSHRMEIEKIEAESLDEKILKSNLPSEQATLVQECFKAAKVKNPKGRRHGIIAFDEMKVQSSKDIDLKTMKFDGFVDYGEDYEEWKSAKMADHALVIQFSSLTANFHQPIAMFGVYGATPGSILVELFLRAIVELEHAGAKIHGIVSDGASTNRKVWKLLGVSGKLNNVQSSFQNPADEKRKIFVLSDAPHLIKCVRNRLYNKKELRVNGESVKWAFYEKLYEVDKKVNAGNAGLRLCPKLTQQHVEPDAALKMRVYLATQIFST